MTAVAGQKFPDSIGNDQGNSPETGLPCPQIFSKGFAKLIYIIYKVIFSIAIEMKTS